ncbi:MAG: hypothetical protein RL341_1435, partial [Pseudomonadota bacterium]
FWSGLLAWMKGTLVVEGMISAKDLDLIKLVDEPQQVVDAIFAFYERRGFGLTPAERERMLSL